MQAHTLEGGFAAPPREAAQAFRSLMEAMARPGTIHTLAGASPPEPLSPAAGAVLLTLVDGTTPVHLAGAADCAEVRQWLAFHTGAPVVAPAEAAFALGTWEALAPLDRFALGTPEYPDRSATLIVELPHLAAEGAVLSGPGIETTAALSLPETRAFAENRRHYPLGRDFLFTCGARLAALPRSTEVR
ncbi:phosphonate C-P lyase system protein PhnH [Roseivivax sp.]